MARTEIDITEDAGGPESDGMPDPAVLMDDACSDVLIQLGDVTLRMTVWQFGRMFTSMQRWWTATVDEDGTL